MKTDLARTLPVRVALADVTSTLIQLGSIFVAVAWVAVGVSEMTPVTLVTVGSTETGDAVAMPVQRIASVLDCSCARALARLTKIKKGEKLLSIALFKILIT